MGREREQECDGRDGCSEGHGVTPEHVGCRVQRGQEFSVAFKGSPMKRAKLRELKRNAAVVVGNSGATSHAENAAVAEARTRALEDADPLVREHVV